MLFNSINACRKKLKNARTQFFNFISGGVTWVKCIVLFSRHFPVLANDIDSVIYLKYKLVKMIGIRPHYVHLQGGSRHPQAAILGVSQSGVRLLTRDRDIYDDSLRVLEHHR